ncbi:perakine reductase-like [Dioscorea cayenensis subsp. rotundata]|uniref:Perakine reductase-like n=1 Tax=Dioscorea cayennensis subsp. rotundata TaxID=55577 RepID=A0AB40CNS4_DIOCR|nr:perakine reductase-like [Dioscorea cayenensis subsp. rotundata]
MVPSFITSFSTASFQRTTLSSVSSKPVCYSSPLAESLLSSKCLGLCCAVFVVFLTMALQETLLLDLSFLCTHFIDEFLVSHPRFTGENLEMNKTLYVRVENLAKNHQCSTAQLALAWVLHQGDDVVPIHGTTKIKNLDSNIGALEVNLTEEDLKEISDSVSEEEVAGSRSFFESSEKFSWKYANTPLPKLA